jgi:hypothetical protein
MRQTRCCVEHASYRSDVPSIFGGCRSLLVIKLNSDQYPSYVKSLHSNTTLHPHPFTANAFALSPWPMCKPELQSKPTQLPPSKLRECTWAAPQSEPTWAVQLPICPHICPHARCMLQRQPALSVPAGSHWHCWGCLGLLEKPARCKGMPQPPDQLCAQHAQLFVHTSTHDRAVLMCTADQVRPAGTSQQHSQRQHNTRGLQYRIRPPCCATPTPGPAATPFPGSFPKSAPATDISSQQQCTCTHMTSSMGP